MLPKYYVINWNTSEFIATFEKLSEAKKYCRALGHEAANPLLTSYPPVAFVGNAEGELIYNPYFRYTPQDREEMEREYREANEKTHYQYRRNFFTS